MALITVRPTVADVAIANCIAAHTNPPTEEVAEALTWGADEHVVCAVIAAWWFYTRRQGRSRRRAADHVLLTTVVASAMPHLFKAVFDQQRPQAHRARPLAWRALLRKAARCLSLRTCGSRRRTGICGIETAKAAAQRDMAARVRPGRNPDRAAGALDQRPSWWRSRLNNHDHAVIRDRIRRRSTLGFRPS
jgi:hypothetical protein